MLPEHNSFSVNDHSENMVFGKLRLCESIFTVSGKEDNGDIYAERCIIKEALKAKAIPSSVSDEATHAHLESVTL